MAGSKDTPRQKMIGMMYLVLTALLALNVSKDVLHSFVVINDGLESTNAIFEAKNSSTMNQFEQQMAFDPEKTRSYFQRAQRVVQLSEELDAHIGVLKRHLIKETEGYDETIADSMYALKKVSSLDNFDIPTEILIGSEPSFPIETEFSALQLKSKIKQFRSELIALFDAQADNDLIAELNEGLSLPEVPKPEGGTEAWETGNFYHMPLAACITNLSKIQTDIKNAEADALKALFQNIRLNDFSFDTIEAKVIPRSNYVLTGEEYSAEVFLAAYSRTAQPAMILGDYDEANGAFIARDSLAVESGLGKISQTTTSTGFKTYDGMIKLKKEDGSFEDYHFQSEYIVAEPSLTVSATKMAVFYKGVKNPVKISVPGVANENITASISGGNTIRKTGSGQYEVTLANNSPREVQVIVTATMPNGEQRSMGMEEFRVKQLPRPYSKIGDIVSEGRMTANELISRLGIRSIYGDDFAFQLKCTVDQFTASFKYQGGYSTLDSKSNEWTEVMKTSFRALPSGTQITFSGIRATGSDDIEHRLSPIVITII